MYVGQCGERVAIFTAALSCTLDNAEGNLHISFVATNVDSHSYMLPFLAFPIHHFLRLVLQRGP